MAHDSSVGDGQAGAGAPLSVRSSGHGDGTPFVLIHGLGSDAQGWAAFKARLPKGHRVHCVELPGHGNSPPRPVTSFDHLAAIFLEAFDALSTQCVNLVGHSLGGALALAIADARPDRIANLTLICPAGLGPEINGEAVEGLLTATQPEGLARWMRCLVADPRLISESLVKAVLMLRTNATPRRALLPMADAVFRGNTQTVDLRPLLDRIECPARVIWGRQDSIVPCAHADRAPDRVAVHILDDAGHLPHLERAREVAALIPAE